MSDATTARPTNAEHPMALGSFRSWVRLLRCHRPIDHAFYPRALFVSLTTLATGPLRVCERVCHGRAIRRTPIHPEPIFIIGHWRSGTTHLQNLLALDENLGSLTTFQAMAPGFCLVGDGAIKRFIARQAAARYPTRLIDNIPLAFDAPQEDEFGLANLSPHAFIHTFSFPRHAEEIFQRSVLFDGLSAKEHARWIETYLRLLQTVTRASGGRRLVVKNCAHTARIPTLLGLFPNAKFVHIHRNPYEVYLSTLHMHRTVFPRSQLQTVEAERIEANVLRFYDILMRRFLADRSRIPTGNLVEIRFADLEAAPIEQLRRIYDGLHLPGFAAAKPAFRAHLDSIAGYRKNAYELSNAVIETVNEHWPYTFGEWGYKRLDPADA
jgi:hypothetical protein